MTELFSTTGIVLGRRDHKEADRVYNFFSRDLGKVQLMSRGGSRVTAKLSPHMESFGQVQVLLVDGKWGLTVAGADIDERFDYILKDEELLPLVTGALHLVDLGTRLHHVEEHLYNDLLEWMRFLCQAPKLSHARRTLLLGSFALEVVAHCGYKPELFLCLGCQNRVEPEGFRWSSARGGVVCSSCVERDTPAWLRVRTLQLETLKLLRFARGMTYGDLCRVELDLTVLSEYHDVIDSLILAHFPVIPNASISAMCRVDATSSFG